MSDLIDRKLKKFNQETKYDHVPFDKRYTYKSVLRSLDKKQTKKVNWMKRYPPLPLIAVLILSCLQLSQGPSHTTKHTASPLTEKNSITELKTDKSITEVSFASDTSGSKYSASPSKMVRETYVIHRDESFVQTDQRVESEQLDEVIGTIQHPRPVKDTYKLTNVTAFYPQTKIYSIKGKDKQDKIAIQSWGNTGLGSTSTGKQGYFIFEKKPGPAIAQ